MATTHELPDATIPYEKGPPPHGRRRRRRRLGVIAVVLAAVALIAAALIVLDDDDDTVSVPGPSPSLTTTVTAAPTTAPPTTNEPTTLPPVVDTATAVWPDGAGATRFADPVVAARSFAVDFAGFVDPVVGPFLQGDTRSGEVEIRPVADGPVTTVFVRQLSGDDGWWVLGAATENIDIAEPATGALVRSPVTLRGRSTAFEANVRADIREDGSAEPLGTGSVMGGANGEFGPFEGELAFRTPQQPYGSLMLSTSSMADGRLWEAAVIRVRFEGGA